jgi:hypothetical protein
MGKGHKNVLIKQRKKRHSASGGMSFVGPSFFSSRTGMFSSHSCPSKGSTKSTVPVSSVPDFPVDLANDDDEEVKNNLTSESFIPPVGQVDCGHVVGDGDESPPSPSSPMAGEKSGAPSSGMHIPITLFSPPHDMRIMDTQYG